MAFTIPWSHFWHFRKGHRIPETGFACSLCLFPLALDIIMIDYILNVLFRGQCSVWMMMSQLFSCLGMRVGVEGKGSLFPKGRHFYYFIKSNIFPHSPLQKNFVCSSIHSHTCPSTYLSFNHHLFIYQPSLTHPSTHSSTHWPTHPLIHWSTHSLIHWPIHLSIDQLTHWYIDPSIYSSIHQLTYLATHPPIYWSIY